MRQVTVLFLATVIVFQAFYNVGVTLHWLANRAQIAATLCENRDKPDLHCDGKCYLKKKIAESPDSAPAQGFPKMPALKKGIELAEFPAAEPSVFPADFVFENPVLIAGEPFFHEFLAEKGIFHPPSFLV